jgi:acetyl esterase/lipase
MKNGRAVWAQRLGVALVIVNAVIAGAIGEALVGHANALHRKGQPAAAANALPTDTPTLAATPTPTDASQSAFPAGPYAVKVAPDVAYGPLPAEKLDLCQPEGAAGPRPAIILIHSSGFPGSDKSMSDTAPQCGNFASQGFVVANINYRLAPDNTWPAQIVDAQLAVRWLRAHAAQYGVDPQRLCASGKSFGGYLAVFLGVLHTIHPGDEAGLYADEPTDVSCVSDFFGLSILNPPEDEVTDDLQGTRLGLLGGVAPADDPALYKDASPLDDVSAQSAPMVIVQGTRDTIVPPSQSLALKQALEQSGVPVTYISYQGEHELQGMSLADEQKMWAQVLAFHVAYQQP